MVGEKGYLDPADLESLISPEMGMDLLTEEEAALFPQPEALPDVSDHLANLALILDDKYLDRLANDAVQWVTEDIASRQGWMEVQSQGMRELGLNPTEVTRPEEWMVKITHPLMKETIIQHCSRAIAELWPPEGPAGTRVLGYPTEETTHQAQRVSDYMNYQYNCVMPGAYEEEERMLLWNSFSGSAFKKMYYDATLKSVANYTMDTNNFIVPYTARDLRTAERFTERYWDTIQDRRRKEAAGVYRRVDDGFRGASTLDIDDVKFEVDKGEGRTQVSSWSDEHNRNYNMYEINCYLDVPGFEDETPLPYTLVVDVENTVVLSLRRAWKATDPLKQRIIRVVHYPFLPGFGFYGWGFVHILGDLGHSATLALRELLDAGFLANAPGGFVSRHSRVSGDIKIDPGKFTELDVEQEALKDAFFPYPFKEPSPTLVKLLDYLDQIGRRVASTTESMVGENSPGTPVGTTMALIEQGSKVISGVHKRLHRAKGEELKIVADLCAEYLPAEYPYNVYGAERTIKAADFDDRVDVVPTADPNIISGAQRVASLQAIAQLQSMYPDQIDRRAVVERSLHLLRVPDPENLLIKQEDVQPMDPVSEFMALLTGKPVKAFPDQDQMAYMASLTQAFMALDPETQKRIEPTYRPLLQEHMALYYQQQAMAQLQQLGLPPEAMQQPGIERFMAMVKPSMLLPFPDDAKQAALDYSVLKEEERKDIRVEGEMRRKEMLAQQQVAVQGEQQSLALANQKMQHEGTLEYTAMVHQLDLMAKQIELQMKEIEALKKAQRAEMR